MGASARHSSSCRKYTELFNCMPCHGEVGTGERTAACGPFCNDWYDACRDEFYQTSMDGATIRPCFGDFLICSPLSAIVSDGPSLCNRMGVSVSDDPNSCYNGTPSAKMGIPEPRPPNDDVEIGGFQFRKGGGFFSTVVRSINSWLHNSTVTELAVAAICVVTAIALTGSVASRFVRSTGTSTANDEVLSSSDEED